MISSVQSLSHVQLFATPWIAARQASLSITNFRSSLKLMSIELVMPSSHLILCLPLLLLPPVPPSIRFFCNESTLHMRWPEYWSFSFSISPSNEHLGLKISLWFKYYQTALYATEKLFMKGRVNQWGALHCCHILRNCRSCLSQQLSALRQDPPPTKRWPFVKGSDNS